MFAHDLSEGSECRKGEVRRSQWRKQVQCVAKEAQPIMKARGSEHGELARLFAFEHRPRGASNNARRQGQDRHDRRLPYLPALGQHPFAQRRGSTEQVVRPLGAISLHMGDGDRLGAPHEGLVGFVYPFFRRACEDDDRGRCEGAGLDRQQGEVRQPSLEGHVDEIVTGLFEIVQQGGGAALRRCQRRKQLVGAIENPQIDGSGPDLPPPRRHFFVRWRFRADDPQQGDIVGLTGEEPGQFDRRQGVAVGVEADRLRHDADAARLAPRRRWLFLLAFDGHRRSPPDLTPPATPACLPASTSCLIYLSVIILLRHW